MSEYSINTDERRNSFVNATPDEILSTLVIAVRQERERCARIADQTAKVAAGFLANTDINSTDELTATAIGKRQAAENIADLIRGGK